jgi:hypothetical protein
MTHLIRRCITLFLCFGLAAACSPDSSEQQASPTQPPVRSASPSPARLERVVYRGTTADGGVVRVAVLDRQSDGSVPVRFAVSALCADADLQALTIAEQFLVRGGRDDRIDAEIRDAIPGTNGASTERLIRVDARATSQRVVGTVSADVVFHNAQSPDEDSRCRTGPVQFSAQRIGAVPANASLVLFDAAVGDVAADETAAWTVVAGDKLVRVDARSQEVTSAARVPAVRALAAAGGDVWIVAGEPSVLERRDGRSGVVKAAVDLPGLPAGVEVQASASVDAVWVVGGGDTDFALFRVDAVTGAAARVEIPGLLPYHVEAAPDGAWVAARAASGGGPESARVVKVDPAGVVVGEIPPGHSGPFSVAAGRLWFKTADDSLAGIDPAGATPTPTTVEGVIGTTAGGGNILWVTYNSEEDGEEIAPLAPPDTTLGDAVPLGDPPAFGYRPVAATPSGVWAVNSREGSITHVAVGGGGGRSGAAAV